MNLKELNIPNSLKDIIATFKLFKRNVFESWCVLHCAEIYHAKNDLEQQIHDCSTGNDSKSSVRVCIGSIVMAQFSNARLEKCSEYLNKIQPPRETAASEFISRYIAKHCNKFKSFGSFLNDQLKKIRELLKPNKSKIQVFFAKNLMYNLAVYATHAIDSCPNKFYDILLIAFQNSNADVRTAASEALNRYFQFTRQKQYPQNLYNQALQLAKLANPKLHSGIMILIALVDHFPEYFSERAAGLISFAQDLRKNDKSMLYPCLYLEIMIVQIEPVTYACIGKNIVKQFWPTNENSRLSFEFLNLIIYVMRKCPDVIIDKLDNLIKILISLLSNFDDCYYSRGSELLLLFMEQLPHHFSERSAKISEFLLEIRYTPIFVNTFKKIIYRYKEEIWDKLKRNIGTLLTRLLDERKATVVVEIIALLPDIPEEVASRLTSRVYCLFLETDLELKKRIPAAILTLAKSQNYLMIVHLVTSLISNAMTSDLWEMRLAILNSFQSPFPSYLAFPKILEHFSVLVNDENFKVRRSALRILGGIAEMNPLIIYPMFRRIILDILFICSSSKSMRVQCDATKCLPIIFSSVSKLNPIYVPVFLPIFIQYMQQQMTRASTLERQINSFQESQQNSRKSIPSAIQTAASSFGSISSMTSHTPIATSFSTSFSTSLDTHLSSLPSKDVSFGSMTLLGIEASLPLQQISEEQMTFFDRIFAMKISVNYINAVGCICKTNFDLIKQNLDEVTSLFIWIIGATVQKKVLIATLSTLSIIIDKMGPEEAAKIPDLNTALLKVGSRLISSKVHAGIFSILGRIGPIAPQNEDVEIVELTSSTTASRDQENFDITLPRDDYYIRVIKNSLDNILDDKNDASLHYLAHQALSRTFSTCRKSVNAQRLFNSYVIRLLNTIHALSTDERPAYFSFITNILDCPTEWLQRFSPQFFELIERLWDTENQLDVIKLIPKLAFSLKDKFSPYMPRVVSMLLDALSAASSSSVANKDMVQSIIMETLTNLSNFATNFIFIIIRQISETITHPKTLDKGINAGLSALRTLVQKYNCAPYSSLLIRTIFKCIELSSNFKELSLQVLFYLKITMGTSFNNYVDVINKNKHIPHDWMIVAQKALGEVYEPQIVRTNLTSSNSKQEGGDNSNDNSMKGSLKQSINENIRESTKESINENACSWKQKKEIDTTDLISSIENHLIGTKDQWKSWIRNFIRAFINQSPSTAIQSCTPIANKSNLFSRKIFNAAFLSCWSVLDDDTRTSIKSIISFPIGADNIPMSVVTILVNLVEFTERVRDPIDVGYFNKAKNALRAEKPTFALYCATIDFSSQSKLTPGNVNQLIQAYNMLGMYEEAKGLNKIVEQTGDQELISKCNTNQANKLGNQLQLLEQLEKWEDIAALYPQLKSLPTSEKRQSGLIFSRAFLQLKKWPEFEHAISECQETPSSVILNSIYNLLVGKKIDDLVCKGFSLLGQQGGPLFFHGFTAVSPFIVNAQQLVELQEYANRYNNNCDNNNNSNFDNILIKWRSRLLNSNCHFKTIKPLLHMRMDILKKEEQETVLLSYLKMARKANEWEIFEQFYNMHFSRDNLTNNLYAGYEYLHFLWRKGMVKEALKHLDEMIKNPTNELIFARLYYKKAKWIARESITSVLPNVVDLQMKNNVVPASTLATAMAANAFTTLGNESFLNIEEVRNLCDLALKIRNNHYPTRNLWAWASIHAFDLGSIDRTTAAIDAITGFASCVKLDFKNTFFDLLQMSSILFRSTSLPMVFDKVEPIIRDIELKRFCKIIPQLIVYRRTHSEKHRQFIFDILNAMLLRYPNAVIFPLLLVSNFGDSEKEIGDIMNQFAHVTNPDFFLAANKVLNGLQNSCMPIAEIIFEGLNNFYLDSTTENVDNLLESIPKFLDRIQNPNCPNDKRFHAKHKDRIRSVSQALTTFLSTKNCKKLASCLSEWKTFIDIVVNDLRCESRLSIKMVAPVLEDFEFPSLSIFSKFEPDCPIIGVLKFTENMKVRQTKQRPKIVKITGTDGKDYKFLLKGHEDLRLDQRMMQFFELMNSVTTSSIPTITLTGVTPLSPNVGIIQWISGCDTIQSLITDYRFMLRLKYRNDQDYVIELENEMMKDILFTRGGNNAIQLIIDNMRPIHRFERQRKVEKLTRERSFDLRDAMWLKVNDAESWVRHTLNFSKTTALMSIVGYIIGLGDRHPGNIMIHRLSGKVIHIDFGDCFEVNKERAQLAEVIPFRLTRNIIGSFGPCSIEGSFRNICEETVNVIRERREAIMSILEIFIREPVSSGGAFDSITSNEVISGSVEINKWIETVDSKSQKRLKKIISRIAKKVNGLDFENLVPLTPQEQVDALIKSATDSYNLSYLYHGWNPLW